MVYSDYGYLTVKASLANDAIPLEDVSVIIRGADEYNRDILFSLLTDIDGLTKAVRLPAPSPELSKAPDPHALPYAKYDVEVSKDGYYTKRILEVPIFPSVNTTLPVNMLSKISFDNGGMYPRGNINATI